MNSMENLTTAKTIIENKLQTIYAPIEINKRLCFRKENNEYIHIDIVHMFGSLVVEYSENLAEAKKNMFEDGDLFYLEDMDEDEIFEAMLKEINQPKTYLSTAP